MASGIAYRCKNLHDHVLSFYPDSLNYEPIGKSSKRPLKKAPKGPLKKGPKRRRTRNPLITRLPLELLHLILLNLDLASLEMLSRVDRKLRDLVRSLPAYSLLREHTPDTIRLIFATRVASHFPINQIFTEFCQPWCRTCREFGSYLYLPTVTRTCCKCFYLRPEYQVSPVKDVCLRFGLTKTSSHSQ